MHAPSYDRHLFEGLVGNSLQELLRREPHYFDYFPVARPPIASLYEKYKTEKLSCHYSVDTLRAALDAGFSYLQKLGIPVAQPEVVPDPVCGILAGGILDAFAAGNGDFPLNVTPCAERPLRETLADAYFEYTDNSGFKYLVRNKGAIPLLLISSTAMPLELWSVFLSDETHDYRLIIVESGCGPLIEGGAQHPSDLRADVDRIAAALAQASLHPVNVLAWCNGARAALDLAQRRPALVESMILLSPSFHGLPETPGYPSKFEDTLTELYALLQKQPKLNRHIERLLNETEPAVDWPLMRDQPERRARTLLELPPKDRIKALRVPISNTDYLNHYMQRLSAEEHYPIKEVLEQLRMPILLITGNYDGATNPELPRFVLDTHGNDVTHAVLDGAGHHIQDLQYPYFRYLVDGFVTRSKTLPTARIHLDQLGRSYRTADHLICQN